EIWNLLDMKSSLNWSSGEAGQVKRYFQERRPDVSADLAKGLWRYWRVHCPNRPLFEETEDNIALLLHARAYGEAIPEAHDDGFFGKLLSDHSQLFSPIMPPRLNWDPRAILAEE